MQIETIYNNFIQNISADRVLLSEPMSKHTSFKIGGNADIFVIAKNIEEIKYILKYVKTQNIPLFILGNGTNLLVRDNGIRGVVLKINMQDVNVGVAWHATRATYHVAPTK